MTKEQKRISKRNHKIAAEKLCLKKGYVLHHKDPLWQTEDVERYIQWNIEDLVVMTKSEHSTLHATGRKFSKESNAKKAWNKGLTKETDSRVAKNAKSISDNWHNVHGDPWNKGQRTMKETNN